MYHCEYFRLGFEEPDGFDYLGEVESNLYSEIENLSVQVMTLQILFKAIYEPEDFEKLGEQNRGYAHAIYMLTQLKPKNLEKNFDRFIDAITNG